MEKPRNRNYLITSKSFFSYFKNNGIDFFTGVPDSILGSFCLYLNDHLNYKEHVVAANEGGAIALAIGYHLASKKIPLVYMQNSGLGNALNPLVSLVSKKVFSIPVFLLIGWRGAPNVRDEPQHIAQGEITTDLLNVLKIPYRLLSKQSYEVEKEIYELSCIAKNNNEPVALLVEDEILEKITAPYFKKNTFLREYIIRYMLDNISENALIISTTGKTSRELYELEKAGNKTARSFYTIGGMGHASQIALSIAIMKKEREVYCIDGDGAAVMHLGGFSIIGATKAKNFKHLIINNGSYESVGGHPLQGQNISFTKIAKACGYKHVALVDNKNSFEEAFQNLKKEIGPSLLEVKVKIGSRSNLLRPKEQPLELKLNFMSKLS